MTYADLLTDYWAHAHVDDPKLRDNHMDDDFARTLREMGIDEADLAAPVEDTEVVEAATYE